MKGVITEFKQLLTFFGLEYFNKYYGTYRGFVVSNEDPEGFGRVTLRVPQVYGKATYDYWAWPVGLYAGNGVGSFFIPEQGDMVWVRFENGDSKYPIWEYGHWNKNFKTPEEASPKRKTIQTKTGLRIVMDDAKEIIQIWKSKNRCIEINKDGVSIGSSEKSNEPAVLGNKNEELHKDELAIMNDLCDSAINFSSLASVAATSNPMTAHLSATFEAYKVAITQIQVKLKALEKKPEGTKSKNVTLD